MKVLKIVECKHLDKLIPLNGKIRNTHLFKNRIHKDLTLSHIGTRGYCEQCSFFNGYDEINEEIDCDKEQ